MSGQKVTIGEASSRLARTKAWGSDVSRLRYATKSRGEVLRRMKLKTVRDVLLHVPHRYLDFSKITSVSHAVLGTQATIVGTLDRINFKRPKPKLSLVEVSVVDSTGVLMCTFFKQPWLAEQLKPGDMIAVSGKVEFAYGYKRMVPSFYEVVAKASELASGSEVGTSQFARVLPVHHLSEGLSANWMRRIASAAVCDYGDISDFLPAEQVANLHLMTEARAVREAHFPTSIAAAKRARKRLAYDELICLQVALMSRHTLELQDVAPHIHLIDGPYVRALLQALPFELTQDQKQAVDEILADMHASFPMNRLLLGDVGTGKTAVAAVALAAVADSHTQAAMMAPTSVLANQYTEKLGPLFDKVGISWTLITGSTPARERSQCSAKIADGQICVVFGTTALLSDNLDFKDLSLVIVDEQHRFGVNQRSGLRAKSAAADQLVMSATPIPRTLALTLYGDMSSSTIANRPHATAGVTTKLVTPENVDIAYDAIADALSEGHQAYVVCPLVEQTDDESELDDVPEFERTSAALHSACATFERLRDRIFADASVGLLHGRMKPEEKDAVMADFRAGNIQILVSTTVIEVGVDVPNATVMLIWDADRFGLATLHQLRGRVGRGTNPGVVYLLSAARGKSPALSRLKALENSTVGLELAEMDLQLRHEGDILGLRQSGGVTLHLVDLVEDADLIEHAHAQAQALMESDPALTDPHNRPLSREVQLRFGTYFEGERSR